MAAEGIAASSIRVVVQTQLGVPPDTDPQEHLHELATHLADMLQTELGAEPSREVKAEFPPGGILHFDGGWASIAGTIAIHLSYAVGADVLVKKLGKKVKCWLERRHDPRLERAAEAMGNAADAAAVLPAAQAMIVVMVQLQAGRFSIQEIRVEVHIEAQAANCGGTRQTPPRRGVGR